MSPIAAIIVTYQSDRAILWKVLAAFAAQTDCLLRQTWVSNVWRVADSMRLLQFYIAVSIVAENRFDNWKMMALGILHGLSGRMGKRDY